LECASDVFILRISLLSATFFETISATSEISMSNVKMVIRREFFLIYDDELHSK
jgi:hypothetical protein